MAEPNKFGLLRKLLLQPEKEPTGMLPYALREAFLTPAEHSFYLVLCQALGGAPAAGH